MPRILVIEDDPQTMAEILSALNDHGFEAEPATTGRAGILLAGSGDFDAIVLDRMLPGDLDGLRVLATLRTLDVTTPVLILSALSEVDERIRGLKAGGDDYLTKPFDFLELTARLDVLMRRRNMAKDPAPSRLVVGDLEIDLLAHSARRGARAIPLQPREYRLLEYLMRNAGQVVTRTMLFEEVWHYRFQESTNVIDVHISKLRRKIDTEDEPSMIRTIRGSGYMLHAAD